MPTIESIVDSILEGKAISSVDPEKVARAEKPQDQEMSEQEKMAQILDHLADNIHRTHHTQTEKTASNNELKKMAVGATIIDTLSKMDSSGISTQCYRNYFRES